MPNYQLGKIYQIFSEQTDKIYIGSTAVPLLCQRFGQHKNMYKRYQNNKGHYISSFEIVQHDDAKIILIEVFPCSSKDELYAREQYHLEQRKEIAINHQRAKRLPHHEIVFKQWRQEHYIKNAENVKEKMKLYYEENTVAINQRVKRYATENSDKIKVARKQRKTCICGKEYSQAYVIKHCKTKFHQSFIETHPQELKTDVLLNVCCNQRN